MKKTLKTLWVLLVSVGLIFPNLYGSIFDTVMFGTTSFPASLDTLTNPAATDSVATVSHSSQHSNANDAIEALEAKLGTGSSLSIADTIFVGNGAGTSRWSSYATGTQAYFTNFFATGSSTLNAFTFTNATGTQATTTNWFSTNASTTNLSGTNISGFNLSSCSGSSFLQWSSSKFGCATPVTSSSFVAETASTSVQYNAKTVSMVSGNTILWWGTCNRGTGGVSMTAGYRTSNDSATTTVGSQGSGETSLHLFGSFTATTTYNVTVETVPSTNCDDTQFMYVLISS